MIELLLILILLVLNGVFAMAEIAIVSAKKARMLERAEKGSGGARLALKLAENPERFLSTVQIGITLVGVLAGAYGGASLAGYMTPWLEQIPWLAGYEEELAFAMVVAFITYLSLIIGELVPKSLAIRIAKPVALWTAPPLLAFYYLFFPVIWLLNKASDLLLRIMGLGNVRHDELTHTADELRLIVEHSVEGGHLSRNERVMIENVLNLEDKTARRIMVPRPDIVYLSLSRPIEDNLRQARQAGHTRFPLCETDLNTVIGMIHVKDLFQAVISQSNLRPDLRKLARTVPFVPESQHLDQLLIEFQRNRVHLAMIVDEFGSTIGMVSLENVLEELVGPIQDEFDKETPSIEPLGDDVYEVDAACPLDRLAETIDIELPETDSESTGAYVIEQLGRLGRPGDSVPIDTWTLTIVQADPNRIRRLRLERQTSPETEKTENPA